MKKINLLAGFIVCILILSACSNDGGGSNQNVGGNSPSSNKGGTQTGEKIDLTWVTYPPGNEDLRKIREEQIVAPFEAQYPNVNLKIVENNEPDVVLQQQLAAGAGPDIVVADGPVNLIRYASAGYLLPLDDYATKYKWNERFYDWALDSGKYDGKLYGLPSEFESLAVYYNKDLFDSKGWKIPANYDELMKLNETIQKDGLMPFSFGTTDLRVANDWWMALAYNNYLGEAEFKKVLENKTPWSSDAMKEATYQLVDMWQKGYINEKQSHAISRDDATALFYSGKSAMTMGGTGMLGEILSDAPPFNVDFFFMPTWKEGVPTTLPMGLGSAWAVNKNSKHPDEAAAFLDAYYNDLRVTESVKLGVFEPLNDLDVDAIEGVDERYKRLHHELDEAFKQGNGGYSAWTYFAPSVRQVLVENIDSVYLGQMTVEDYLKKLDESAKKAEKDGTLFKFND